MSNAQIERQWTSRLRRSVVDKLPPDKLLPDTQPAYVASWIYVFGVTTMAALGVVIATGCILALDGPQWWHSSSLGHFVNSMHLWSVEVSLHWDLRCPRYQRLDFPFEARRMART